MAAVWTPDATLHQIQTWLATRRPKRSLDCTEHSARGWRLAQGYLYAERRCSLVRLIRWYNAVRGGSLNLSDAEHRFFAGLDHCGHLADEDEYQVAAADHAERGGDIVHQIRTAETLAEVRDAYQLVVSLAGEVGLGVPPAAQLLADMVDYRPEETII